MKERFKGEIVGMSISDSDLPGWTLTLGQMGLPQEEIDRILIHLNETYAQEKERGTVSTTEIYEIIEKELGRPLTNEEKKEVRKKFEAKLPEILGKSLEDPKK